jgi:hypothetical protein
VRHAAAFTAWLARHDPTHVAQAWDAEAITSVECERSGNSPGAVIK